MTRVSVLLSAHNSETSVEQAIASLQDQTVADWELIAVDDGSSDATPSVLERLARTDVRIRFLTNASNLGLAASLNHAASEARASLLARLDADDVCLPDRLELQIASMEAMPGVDVLGGGAVEVSPDGTELGISLRPERHETLVEAIHKRNPFIHPTVMMRRSFFAALRGYDASLRRAQDYDLWLRGYRCFRYHNLQVPLIRYCRRPPTLTDALYSTRVLLKAARRERRPRLAALALRPLLAAAQSSVARFAGGASL